MKNHIKLLTLLSTAMLTTTIMVSCGPNNTSTNSSVKTVTFWMPEQSKAGQEVYDEFIKAFNAEHAGEIQLNVVGIPRGNGFEYENKINAAATSNTLPDAIFMDGPTVANYVNANIISPISKYFTEEELSDFVPSIITQGTVDNELYAIGPAESSVVLYCNTDVFNAAGIEIPATLEDAWTWDEVYEISKQLQTDNMYGINLTWDLGEGQIYGLSPILWSNGAELVDSTGTKANGYVNSPESIEALKRYQSFATEGLMNLQALPDEFANGKSAMSLMGSWEYQNLKNNFPDFNFEVTYYPTSNNEVGVVSPSGDWVWGITTGAQDEALVADIIKYLTSPEFIESYTTAIVKPAARISILESQKLPPVIKEQAQTTAHPRPITTSYPVLSKEFSSAMQDIRTGADVQDALDVVAQRFEQDIERNK